MKIWLYPAGFDPVIASGPPTPDYLAMGMTWTVEDTVKHRRLQTKAQLVEVDVPPDFRWYMQTD